MALQWHLNITSTAKKIYIGIVVSIRIGREIQCLLYADFILIKKKKKYVVSALLSAHVEIFSVSRMRNFFSQDWAGLESSGRILYS